MNSNPNENQLNFSEGNNAIFISHPDMYYHKYITAEEIEEINQLIGIENFIGYPEDNGLGYGCGCEKLIEIISIIVNEPAFREFSYKLLGSAVVAIVKAMKKRFDKNKDKKYILDFKIKDERREVCFNLQLDANATPEQFEGLLDKAKELIEVAKK